MRALYLGAAAFLTLATPMVSCGSGTAAPGDAGTDAASPSFSGDGSSDVTSSSSSGSGSSSGSVGGSDCGATQIVGSTDAGPLGSTACEACLADSCQSLACACAGSEVVQDEDVALLNAKTACGGTSLPAVAAGNGLIDCVASSCASECLGP